MNRAVRKIRYRLLSGARIIVQLAALALFFFLFIKTDYTDSDTLQYAVNILFRLDPLLALATMLALKTVIALMFPAVIIVVLSLVSGRSFCGWLCPMGALLDCWSRMFRRKSGHSPTRFPDLPAVLLVIIVVSAVLGVPLAGYIDPFSILVRGLSQAVYPGFNEVTVSFFTFTYDRAPESVNLVTEPLYAFLQKTVLPADQKYYRLGLISLAVLGAVFVLEFYQRRFFCRSVCPLGALLGWCAGLGLLSVQGGDDTCGRCRICRTTCRMGAVDEDRRIDPQRCTLCMDCFTACPRQIIAFDPVRPVSGPVGLSLSRRRFMGSAAAAVILPSVIGTRTLAVQPDPLLIRPPGSTAEIEFLQRCVRCGQCMQVCITNGLQPVMLRAGVEGMFSPYLVARTGYCEFNCTLCGQVCPTGAIAPLEKEEKHRFKIGHAWFDKNLCLPFAKNTPCIVCEEHCPTPEKAIRFQTVSVVDEAGETRSLKQPYVVDDLCIGCGICETMCPLPGRPGIFVTSDGEVRNPDNRLPSPDTETDVYG